MVRNGSSANDATSWSPTVAYTGSASSSVKVDDSDSGIVYSGSWFAGTPNSAYYNSTIHWSTTANNYAQYTFIGTDIKWYASKNNGQGKADVYIDGVLDATLDLYSATTIDDSVVAIT